MEVESRESLLQRNRDLQERLEEAEETLQALRSGEVDALVVSGPQGDSVYTLFGADEAYRTIVQGMAEGALTLTIDGLILFSNEQFATLLRIPLQRVIGSRLQDFVATEDADAVSALLNRRAGRKAEVNLRQGGSSTVPVYLSVDNLVLDGVECLCVIVTDLSERKRNDQIVAAEKLARSILEQAAEAILVVEPDGRISRASRVAESLAGTPVLQQSFDEVFRISSDSGQALRFDDILTMAKRQQSFRDLETSATMANGRKVELLLSAAILSGPDSELLGCVVNLTDITERKRREQQLRFQADILETTAEAVVAIDRRQRVSFWNSGAEQLYGVSRENAVGRRLTDLYQYVWLNPDDERRSASALATQGMWSGENIHIRNDGRSIFVSSMVNVIREEHGGGMFAVIRDITESKKAEAVLRESEARERSRAAELQGIMEAVPAAVSIARDSECRSITGNHMAYKLLRIPYGANYSSTAPEAGPRPFREMKDGRELLPEELPMQMAARTGTPVHDFEFDLAFEDGTVFSWIGNAVPLFDEAGQSCGAVGAFVDITERKRAEERLRHTQKLESIGLLAGGIAHDFNNLLVGVIGNASLAQDVLEPGSPAADLIKDVIETGEQLANLTRQMLAYAGKGRFVVELVNLSDLIPKVSGLIRPSISKKTVLKFDLAKNLPAIEADRSQLQQIFMNLVLNAAEAIGQNPGLIVVRDGVREIDQRYIAAHPEAVELRPGTYVFLEVSDTGSGMDRATQSKVFDPFFTTKFLGRGLGLAAVQGIVHAHKGAISVKSALGRGSCFTVLLPAAQGKPASGKTRDNAVLPQGTGTVLVVDDEVSVRKMVRQTLTRYGYEVLLASSGPDAIDILKRHPGDLALVILDLSMPGMNGQEVLPEIRKIRPGVKVIISSGYNETETMALFHDQRVSGFIQKPYTASRLTERVKSTLS